MNRRDAVFAVAYLEQVAAALTAKAAKLRDDLADDARAEFEEQATAPTWRIADIATVSAAVSRPGVSVANETRFAEWVQRRYPSEVEVKVRPDWRKTFLAKAKVSGDVVCDPDGGEVIPGLAPRAGGEFRNISVKVTGPAEEVFAGLAAQTVDRLLAESDLPAVRALAPVEPLAVADAAA